MLLKIENLLNLNEFGKAYRILNLSLKQIRNVPYELREVVFQKMLFINHILVKNGYNVKLTSRKNSDIRKISQIIRSKKQFENNTNGFSQLTKKLNSAFYEDNRNKFIELMLIYKEYRYINNNITSSEMHDFLKFYLSYHYEDFHGIIEEKRKFYIFLNNYIPKKMVISELENKKYRNSRRLREVLLKKIDNLKSFSKINGLSYQKLYLNLKGKTECIKSELLRQIILALDIDKMDSIPPIRKELKKIELEKEFKSNEKNLYRLSREELFLKFWSVIFSIDQKLKIDLNCCEDLIFEDLSEFFSYMGNSYHGKYIFNCMFDSSPYFEAKKMLSITFLSELYHSYDFTAFYKTLKEKERKVMNRFIRNYSRFDDRHYDKIRQLSEKVFGNDHAHSSISFINKYSLDVNSFNMSLWHMDETDRNIFSDVIHNYNL